MYWATRISSVGFAMVLPAALGYWLDGKWGTSPWLVISGACLGFLASMLELLKLVRLLDKPRPDSGASRRNGADV